MSNPKNNEKYLSFGIVINAQKESANPYQELAQLQATLLKHKEFFVATIIHDKDKDENNYNKITHLHAYIEFPNTKHTKKQLLELLSGCLNIEQIRLSIEPTNNGFLLVQYLTHKNDQNKHQYNYEDILTNNEDLLSIRYNQIYLTKEQRDANLEYDIKTSKTMLEFLERQGIQNAKNYRNVFNDIKREQRLDLDRMLNLDNKLDLFVDWLLEHKRILEQNAKLNEKAYTELMLIYNEIHTRFKEYFSYRN